MQGQRQGQNQDQDQESKVRGRISVKSLRSVAGTGAIGRGQESKVRVQESKVRTISRARV